MGAADKPAVADDEIDLRELIGSLIGARWTILLFVGVSLVLGVMVALLSDPVYRATAVVELEKKGGTLALPAEMQDLLGGGEQDSRVLTEIEIIRSRIVLNEVVDELKLDILAKPRSLPVVAGAVRRFGLPDIRLGLFQSYAWSDEMIRVGELEVPDQWMGKTITLTSLGEGRYSAELPDESAREGKVGLQLADAQTGFALRVDDMLGEAGREFRIVKIAKEQAVNNIREKLAIAETTRQSSVLKLDFTGDDRDFTKQVMDAIVRAYLGQNLSRNSAEAAQSLDFVTEQLPQSQKAVIDAQNALNDYRQKQQSVDLTLETEALLGRVTEIEQKLAELALEEEEYKQRFTINHPTYEALLQNRAKLNEQLSDLKAQSGDLPETQKEVFNLTRDLEVAQNVYLALLNRQQELQVLRASVIGNIRVLDNAFTPERPIAPRKSMIVALSLVLGLVGGAGYVFVRRIFHVGVRGSEDIEKLGLPVFATIGLSDKTKSLPATGTLPILAVTEPTDLVIEALRSLRTSLHFGMLDAKTASIVITSAAPGAGKSFTAVNLAVVAAEAGQRVCLVDADMRRGYLRRYFGLRRDIPGLSGYLAGDHSLEQAIVHTKVNGLDFISTGAIPPNPAELLMRRTFPDMLEKLNSDYDLVLLDAPPTLAVTDPVVMGRSAGATIMVVRFNQTAVGEVEVVMRNFETAGGRISGAILNGVEADGLSYGNRYYHYNRRYEYKSSAE